DGLRFQLIFDLCEDLRVDSRIQQLVPNYLNRLAATAVQGARHPESAAYYALALESVAEAIAAVHNPGSGGRFEPVLRAGATIVDSWKLAKAIYDEDTLPPVVDLEAFHAA